MIIQCLSRIFFIYHFHDNSYRTISVGRRLFLLRILILALLAITLRTPLSELNAWQNNFRLLLKIRERASQSLIDLVAHVLNVIVKLSLRVPCTSSTVSSHIRPWWQAIASVLIMRSLLSLRLEMSLSLITLAIVIEIVEHEVEIGIYISSQMILHSFLFIYGYAKRLLFFIVRDKAAAPIYLAIALVREPIVLVRVIRKSTRLRKISRTLWLVEVLFVCIWKIIFILRCRARYVNLFLSGFVSLIYCWIQSCSSYSLLWFSRSRYKILLLIILLLDQHLRISTSLILLHLSKTRSHCTTSTP